MNRAKLLAIDKANGYTGEADLAKVKSWLADNGIELKTADGKAVDVDVAWKAVKAVTIADDEEPATKSAKAAGPEDETDGGRR